VISDARGTLTLDVIGCNKIVEAALYGARCVLGVIVVEVVTVLVCTIGTVTVICSVTVTVLRRGGSRSDDPAYFVPKSLTEKVFEKISLVGVRLRCTEGLAGKSGKNRRRSAKRTPAATLRLNRFSRLNIDDLKLAPSKRFIPSEMI